MTALGVEYGCKYTLTGPNGAVAVFNDSTDPNFVGILSPETSGLDSPDIREDAADIVEGDGGIHGDFYTGRRPIVLQGTIIASSPAQRNERIDKLQRASMALRGDATLLWQPAGAAEPVSTAVRRQQPLRVTKGYVKDFLLPLVAADPRIYGTSQVITKTYSQPEENLSFSKGPGTIIDNPVSGTKAWASPEFAKTNNNEGTLLTGMVGESFSHVLQTSVHGFGLPTEAKILGIGMNIETENSSPLAGPGFGTVQLTKAGVPVGTNKATPTQHSWQNNQLYPFGGPTDLWGTTWTASQINATGFGAWIIAKHFPAQENSLIGGIDWISITVYYSVNTETHAQTITTNGTVNTPPIITVYGQVLSSGIEIINSTSGKTFKTESKPLAGQNLQLDFAKKTALLFGAGTDEYGKVTFDPNAWWELVPGANNLILPPSSKVEVAWRNAWM